MPDRVVGQVRYQPLGEARIAQRRGRPEVRGVGQAAVARVLAQAGERAGGDGAQVMPIRWCRLRAEIRRAVGSQGAAALVAANCPRPLAEQRIRLGLTQAQVARRMGVRQEWVLAIERAGPGAIQVRTLAGYVEALGGRLDVIADFGGERILLADKLARREQASRRGEPAPPRRVQVSQLYAGPPPRFIVGWADVTRTETASGHAATRAG